METAVMWRVFIGDGDPEPDWVHLDKTVERWKDAMDMLDRRLRLFQGDSCDSCRRAGTEAYLELVDMGLTGREQEFTADVDGEIYRITAVSGGRSDREHR